MAVEGRELASLDFGNLIGGPLNAIVESQAKAAITTANFVKQVGFDQDGKVINTTFKYNKKDEEGNEQECSLTVPFITMLPIPYIKIDEGTVEFNAKITSTTSSSVSSTFSQDVNAGGSTGFWFARARVNSKTSYQKQSSSSDVAKRTFDMHVNVKVRGEDMPAGTERLLTLLEGVIEETKTPINGSTSETATVANYTDTNNTYTITLNNNLSNTSWTNVKVTMGGTEYDGRYDNNAKTIVLNSAPTTAPAQGDQITVKSA